MINYLSFDIEDWFQVENFKGYISFESWNSRELRVERNTDRILDLLSGSRTKATFFILGWIAEKCPHVVKKIAREGHEVASHGFNHELIYRQTPEAFREDISSSKKLLENISGEEVVGYRAPSFSVTKESQWAVDVLKECGFKYDSSIFPTSLHDRYGYKGVGSDKFVFPNGLVEAPIATYEMGGLRLPVGGGGYFRLLPYAVFHYFLQSLNKKGKSFVFYLHPWEMDPGQPKVPASAFFTFRHYNNIAGTEQKMKKLLRDFSFQPIRAILG